MPLDYALIFPHQLFADHPVLQVGRPVVLVEDSLFFGDARYPVRFHSQKLILHRASMRAYADSLIRNGDQVDYIEYDSDATIATVIAKLAGAGCRKIHAVDPVDDVLERRLQKACATHNVECCLLPTPMFLTDLEWGIAASGKRPPFRMSSFYTAQRRCLGILLEGDKPVGGAWSFDADNRRKWPRGRQPPLCSPASVNPWVEEATRYVERRFPNRLGASGPFLYPVTHEQANDWLQEFVDQRLDGFGSYEDAMVAGEDVLHHSLLTPMLNTGLLTPQRVVDAVLESAAKRQIALNDLEGFIRQVIGWREFMRIMYRRIGVQQRNANFWGNRRAMPESLYDGTTGIAPVDIVIQRLLRGAYCHHIERLMVLGNFMLLCEIQPDAVYRWFMEFFIDAYDWVMVPNVYGMSQFADGGLLCTKPYISGSNYVKKMSDFKPGPWCDVWDGLFWRFIHVHKDFFASQPRLSMMARQLDRMKSEVLARHIRNAEDFLDRDCQLILPDTNPVGRAVPSPPLSKGHRS